MSTNANEPDADFLGPSAEVILACIADAVISTDAQGKILLFNPAAEKLFGYIGPEVLGKNIQLLIPLRFRENHDRQVAGFGSASSDVARAMANEREVFGLRRDGTEFPAEAMLSRRFLGGKTLITVVIRDTSYQKSLNEQRNLIASEMAHRFRNLMAVVNSLVSLTAGSVSTVEEFRDSTFRSKVADFFQHRCYASQHGQASKPAHPPTHDVVANQQWQSNHQARY